MLDAFSLHQFIPFENDEAELNIRQHEIYSFYAHIIFIIIIIITTKIWYFALINT